MSDLPVITTYRELRAYEAENKGVDPPVKTTLSFMMALKLHRETSLRDDFAKAVITGAGGDSPKALAQWAYAVADAMIVEGAKK